MPLSNNDHRTLFTNLLAYILSSGGLIASIVAVLVLSILPSITPKPPRKLPPSTKAKRRHSAPAALELPSHSPSRPPLNRIPTSPLEPRTKHSTWRPKRPAALRQLSINLDRPSSLLARTLTSSHRRFSSLQQQEERPNSEVETSPRSSISSMDSSPSLLSLSDSNHSPQAENTPLSRRSLTRAALPSIKQVFRDRRKSKDSADESASGESVKRSPFMKKHKLPQLKEATTFTIPWSSKSSTPDSPRKSIASRLSRHIPSRSPSHPIPRTQPYGAPYFAAVPQLRSLSQSSSDFSSVESFERASRMHMERVFGSPA